MIGRRSDRNGTPPDFVLEVISYCRTVPGMRRLHERYARAFLDAIPYYLLVISERGLEAENDRN